MAPVSTKLRAFKRVNTSFRLAAPCRRFPSAGPKNCYFYAARSHSTSPKIADFRTFVDKIRKRCFPFRILLLAFNMPCPAHRTFAAHPPHIRRTTHTCAETRNVRSMHMKSVHNGPPPAFKNVQYRNLCNDNCDFFTHFSFKSRTYRDYDSNSFRQTLNRMREIVFCVFSRISGIFYERMHILRKNINR